MSARVLAAGLLAMVVVAGCGGGERSGSPGVDVPTTTTVAAGSPLVPSGLTLVGGLSDSDIAPDGTGWLLAEQLVWIPAEMLP